LLFGIPLWGCPAGPPKKTGRIDSQKTSQREPAGSTVKKRPRIKVACGVHRPCAAKQGEIPKLPKTKRQTVVDTLHGVKVSDPYRWLESMKNPETRRWLAAQNAHARARLAKLADRDKLLARLQALSYVESVSPPRRRGKRYFFSRRPKGKEKAIQYYREGKTGAPKVLLDPNTLSKDGSVSLRGFVVSWDGKKVAYKLSQNAADESTLYVMDVASKKVSKIDTIAGAKYAHPSWTPDSKGFYYTRLPVDKSIPVADRPGYAAVYYHRLGSDPKSDRLVHRKTGDPQKFIQAAVSRDGRYLFVYLLHGWTRTDVYYRRRGRNRRGFRKLAVGLDAKFVVIAHKRRFYIHTNYRAPNYRLFRVKPGNVALAKWQEIVPERQHGVLRDVSIVGGKLALRYLQRASTQLELASLDGKKMRQIGLPGIGTAYGLYGQPSDDEAYYIFSSFIQPSTIYETSIKKGGRKRYFKLDVPVDPKPYTIDQVFYRSKDGTRVSMFIVRKKDLKRDGSTPFLLYGYGGFDINITPRFRATRYVWLEAGGALAYPNLRGGGEYGESWHRAGMLTNKQNVFDDFIYAAQYLIKQGYTKADRLAIQGGSNGGLLMGAAMTQRPELFRAVSCSVPLLDMVRYHLFGSGKTWINEYGSADNEAQFRALYAYSPYHRVKPKTAYPALLMLSADSDDRVDPMHARKFVAAIQHANSGKHPILLRVESKAGHGGGDMIKKRVQRLADDYAFLFSQVGLRFR
jgi:prolyl oligopeptidase